MSKLKIQIVFGLIVLFSFSLLSAAQSPPAAPDLKILKFSGNPNPGMVNKPVKLNCIFANTGISMQTTWTAELLLNGAPLYKQDFTPAQAPNTQRKISYAWTPSDEGNYTITCRLDDAKSVGEINRKNNEKTISLRVDPEPVDFGIEEIRTNKEKYIEPQYSTKVKVTCIYFGIGMADADIPPLKVKAYFNDGSRTSKVKTVHKANGIVNFVLKTDMEKTGKLTVGCEIDPDKKIRDSNRSNNRKEKEVQLQNRRDMVQAILNHTFVITLYDDVNFSGEKKEYKISATSYKAIMYFGGQYGFKNNILSSIKIPDGCKVTLYPRENLKGTKEVLKTSDNWLGDNAIGNDKASSMEIECGRYIPKK